MKFIVIMNGDYWNEMQFSLEAESMDAAVAYADEQLYDKALDHGAFEWAEYEDFDSEDARNEALDASVWVHVEEYDPEVHFDFLDYEQL